MYITDIINAIVNALFHLEILFYIMTLLQWYSYSIYRVIFKHHKPSWHFIYIVLPTCIFLTSIFLHYEFVNLILVFVLGIALYRWHRVQDKKLKFTSRIKRLVILSIVFIFASALMQIIYHKTLPVFYIFPILWSLIISYIYEYMLMDRYIEDAKSKLNLSSHTIIMISASYGKTSIKKFLYTILSKAYKTYVTPKSVNTLKGIVTDINQNLQEAKAQIYIVEAGARKAGDIEEIAMLVRPKYAVIGEIGEQHLEYFKNLQNITNTKFEVLKSPRLEKAFVYQKNPLPTKQALIDRLGVCVTYGHNYEEEYSHHKIPHQLHVRNIESTLEDTKFELEINQKWYKFRTEILGVFNVYNIIAAIGIALELQVDIPIIQNVVASLTPVEHRLQKIRANNKIIIDDSFNGNLKGMLEAIRLGSLYQGRKVIVTPGIIESTPEQNIELARAIDEYFDVVIITGMLNAKILSSNIKKAHKITLQDKHDLQNILASSTRAHDLILFCNDAPTFI